MCNHSILRLGGILVQFNQTSVVDTKAEPGFYSLLQVEGIVGTPAVMLKM